MGKGRDKELIKLRDEALCRRYYYWTEIKNSRSDNTFKASSNRNRCISVQ